jgi:SAM-dependent methyltransferase
MEALERIAICPVCRGPLEVGERGFACPACGVSYPVADGQADLRPRTAVERSVTIEIQPLTPDPTARTAPLPNGPWPPIQYPRNGSFKGGNRLSPELTTHLAPAAPGDVLLDLGCGDALVGSHLAAQRGYDYVGVDVYGAAPTALVDAHTLPFADGSVAAACTFAVLEHVRMPHLVARELARVLRPGATLIGTVAFLEPLHAGSHFHHTHIGTFEILTSAGFDPVMVEANLDWRASDALYGMYTARGIPMGRYLRPLFRPTLRVLTRSTRVTTKRHPEELEIMTAGYRFVARRPS